jgi:hypothetical protein
MGPAGGLDFRRLVLGMVSADATHTDVRVDAQVTWRPARPASTFLPSGTHAVVITLKLDGNERKQPPAPVTVTDPVKVARLVSLVNGLPMYPPGIHSCMAGGRALYLAFLARAGGPPIGTALAEGGGCGGVLLVIGAGKPDRENPPAPGQTGLGVDTAPARQALAISGLHWKLAGYMSA